MIQAEVLLHLFPGDAQRQMRELFPWADDWTIVQMVNPQTVTLDDGLVLLVEGNSKRNTIMAVRKSPLDSA